MFYVCTTLNGNLNVCILWKTNDTKLGFITESNILRQTFHFFRCNDISPSYKIALFFGLVFVHVFFSFFLNKFLYIQFLHMFILYSKNLIFSTFEKNDIFLMYFFFQSANIVLHVFQRSQIGLQNFQFRKFK